MKNNYTHLLFDLDHTLWDFNTNCLLALKELFEENSERFRKIDFNDFYQKYLFINNQVWRLYDQDKITKDEMRTIRFRKLLLAFGINDFLLADELEEKYLFACPKKGILLPNATELLEKVKNDFDICLITNGFHTSQEEKVKYAGLDLYFKKMFSSESTGYKKPKKKFFETVLTELNVAKENCLVIGDNPHTDIKGAINYGIDSLWVNTQKYNKTIKPTYYTEDLNGIISLF
jgi:putative hydrolase of the HAD superfamily